MESQQQMMNDQQDGSGKSGFMCRQSSTRWTPTTEQIRILKDLYYNNGVRSPSAEHIQRISARLRQYGKIEGKNVFYWFQNHKARERQKKRFTTTSTTTTTDNHITNHLPMQRHLPPPTPPPAASAAWKTEDPKYSNMSHTAGYNNSSALGASHGGLTSSVGQAGNYGYGSVTMEKSFRECSISPEGRKHCTGGSVNQNLTNWVSIDHYAPSHNFFDQDRKSLFYSHDEDDDDDNTDKYDGGDNNIETLPLFPMHAEDINLFCKPNPPDHTTGYGSTTAYCSSSGWYRSGADNHLHHGNYATSRASLELSLNSYTGRSVPDSI